jgi:hypothetical protein
LRADHAAVEQPEAWGNEVLQMTARRIMLAAARRDPALILYRSDVRPLFEGRSALRLVDRLLPEPATR